MKDYLSVSVAINSDLETVWNAWVNPDDIKKWNVPFSDWHCPKAENNPVKGGRFDFRMESIHGEQGFNFKGEYTAVDFQKRIESLQADGRKSIISFQKNENQVEVLEKFQPEANTAIELQEEFCQSVLDKFKKYVESTKP